MSLRGEVHKAFQDRDQANGNESGGNNVNRANPKSKTGDAKIAYRRTIDTIGIEK